ncbi:MAG: dihydroorotase [Elusimicrobiota bacterium]
MKRSLLIRNGRVVDPRNGLDGKRDVLIKNGRISTRIDKSNCIEIDASGLLVLPGIIDMHVHLREPGQEDSETIATGTRAASRGGVTTVVAMPNTRPPVDGPALLRRLRLKAGSEASVNILFCGAVTAGQKGEHLTDMRALASAGAAAFSEDGRPVLDPGIMRTALRAAAKLGRPLLDHAEDPRLSAGGVLHEGQAARRFRVKGIPSSSETLMVLRDLVLAERSLAPLHVCHVSCAGTVELIRQAKRRGLPVTAEATPHHFTLSDRDIPAGRSADFKMKPPLRSPADRQAVREGLADGTLDAIATDHAPHHPRLKARGLREAPFGVIGLETLVPLALALVREGVMPLRRLVELMSANPARILGVESKGHLGPGADADVTLIDPRAAWTVSGDFESKSRNSPFVGRRMQGRVVMTIVGGEIVYNGKT